MFQSEYILFFPRHSTAFISSMFFRLVVFFAFVSVSLAGLTNIDYDTDLPHRCAKSQNLKMGPNDTNLFEDSEIAKSGLIFRVVGITSNCYVFYGWLHDIVAEARTHGNQTHDDKHLNHPSPDLAKGECRQKNIMLMRSEGVSQRMLLVVDRYGRRVRVQSAFSGSEVVKAPDLMWRKLKHDRREQFYTAPVHKGFVITSFINANYRVFVIAMNHHQIRIYELRVFVNDDHTLVPYLRDEVMEPTSMIITPLRDLFPRVVHDLETKFVEPETGKAEKKVKTPKPKKGATTPKVKTSAQETDNTAQTGKEVSEEPKKENSKTTGFVFVPFSLVGSKDTVYAPAMPITSLLSSSFTGVHPTYNYTHFAYQEKFGKFSWKTDTECKDVLDKIMVYTYQMEDAVANTYAYNDIDITYKPGDARQSAFTFSHRTWFNPKHFHRRMSYPHTVHRMVDRMILKKGWKDLAPVFVVTILAIVVVSFIVSFVVGLRDKKARRMGKSVSFSSNTA